MKKEEHDVVELVNKLRNLGNTRKIESQSLLGRRTLSWLATSCSLTFFHHL